MILVNGNIKFASELEEVLIDEDIVLTDNFSYYPLDWDKLKCFDKATLSKIFDIDSDEWNCVNVIHNVFKDKYCIIATEFSFDWNDDFETFYNFTDNFVIEMNKSEIETIKKKNLVALRI